jgi:uncharacterized membrane protein YcaP (DUF421 family)
MWFDTWSDVLRILIIGTASYVTLVLLLLGFGKRTLGQLNAFDFIVTVALGSTLATILLNSSVSWSEGLAALVVLAFLQFLVAWVSARRPRLRSALTSEPVLLLRDGRMLTDVLRGNRLTESEVLQAVRGSGSGDVSDIAAVVLETNGKLSVITKSKFGSGSALQGVQETAKDL